MRAIAVDDEKLALESLRVKLSHIERISEVHAFLSSAEALDFFKGNGADVAFLDINMAQLDGLALARRMREVCPGIIIIFVTGYVDYALDAMNLHADGYIMKPVDEEDIEKELDDLERRRAPARAAKRVRVQTFGNFEVYADGKPLHFARSKAKEAFAYLVHKRGSACTVKELAAVLFEDKPYDKRQLGYMQVVLRAMTDAFHDANADEVLTKSRNSYAINAEKIDCDYFRFNALEPSAFSAYTGEYMSQYGWAEFTAAYLDAKLL